MVIKKISSLKNTGKLLAMAMTVSMALMMSACGGSNQDIPSISDTEETMPAEDETFIVHPRQITPTPKPEKKYPFEWKHGSCKYIEDKTLIVSIFLNDLNYKWDENNEEDAACIENELTNLTTATEWLTEKTADYEKTADFVFDWHENRDLKYLISADADIFDSEDENAIWDMIDTQIDTSGLLKKYEADNILYVLYANTPKNWDKTSFTWIYENDVQPYEFVVMYPYYKGDYAGPVAYAHELMHAFGAHDLYLYGEGITYVTTEEYYNHLRSVDSKDIMFSVCYGDDNSLTQPIERDFSELDAYYMGMCDAPAEVSEYGLDDSEY